jgi:two-component system cell cycle sensor histidine kinase/response regulator CckA
MTQDRATAPPTAAEADPRPVPTEVRPLRVLVAEDSEDDLLLVLRMIRQGGFDPVWQRVQSAEGMRAALASGRWDIVIADHSMPGFTGLEALELTRRHDADLPFLLVSGTVGEQIAVDAMRAGARDYLMKGHLARLAPAIRRELDEAHNRRERDRLSEELRQAQKMEAVGRLAGGVAHDFNNLLTAINGYADLLLADLPESDQAYAGVREIRAAGERATALTRQLLAFGRRQVLDPRVLDLGGLVANISPMLGRLIGENIRLEQLSDGTKPFVRADPGQLEQVILNLAVNSRDAMPDGGQLSLETGTVTFDSAIREAHVGLAAGRYAMLAVTDNGGGMDAETQSHIFEPFFTTKESGKGTGLGLATVWGIVRQSEGHVWVYSEPGIGTTFKVYLPLVESAATGAPVAPQPAVEGQIGGRETILLVEDEPSVRAIVVQILRRQGYRLLVASNADEAERVVSESQGRIDLLLSDVIMPGLGGPALAEILRSRFPGLHVLFVSGYTDDAIVHHGVLEPGVAFLQKPFTPERLGRKVREVLDTPSDDAGTGRDAPVGG